MQVLSMRNWNPWKGGEATKVIKPLPWSAQVARDLGAGLIERWRHGWRIQFGWLYRMGPPDS